MPHIHNIIQEKSYLARCGQNALAFNGLSERKELEKLLQANCIVPSEFQPRACTLDLVVVPFLPERARCWQTFNSRALLLGAHYGAAARLPESLLTTVFTFIAFLVGENICLSRSRSS